jgi:glycosyltransferase involved in cell wall biosynthesis
LVLVQSRAFVDLVRARGARADTIRYFPNSADALYCPVEPRMGHASGVLPDGFRVMFAGNVGAAQSFETILAAAEVLRDRQAIHWIILGEGRQSGWVREEIARRGLGHCVHMLGRHPENSMPEWFAQADVMLVTLKKSPIFALTIPSKVQSYMACGRPIVAALDGEGARVVEEACAGIVVPAEDATALAEAVVRLSEMPSAERDSMGLNGRRYFLQEFERDALITRLDTWMKEITGVAAKCAS